MSVKFDLATRTDAVAPSDVLVMIELAKEMEKDGIKVTYMVQGQPDFDTPAHIKQAAYDALEAGYTGYPPGEGYIDLRQAVARKLKRENGLEYDPAKEIIITNGAALGIYLAVTAVVNPGDDVLVTNPGYASYHMVVGSAGGRPNLVPLRRINERWMLTEEDLEEAVTDKTKAIILNSPGNPSGRVMTEDEYRMVGSFAKRHNLIVITDEVYEHFVYDGRKHISIAGLSDDLRGRTITLNSFSKTYAMTGWRLGYVGAPDYLTSAMAKMNAVAGRAAAAFVQRAGIVALDGPQDCVKEMAESYARRREIILEELKTVPGISYSEPEGAFYVFVDASEYKMDCTELAKHVLKVGHVVTTPGTYYGSAGEGHLRLSFCIDDKDIRTGVAGLRTALEALR